MHTADLANYSYTSATGKRPQVNDGWVWYDDEVTPSGDQKERDILPMPVFARLEGGRPSRWGWRNYETREGAILAADAAYRHAVESGLMEPPDAVDMRPDDG